jgi:hypothetical protein
MYFSVSMIKCRVDDPHPGIPMYLPSLRDEEAQTKFDVKRVVVTLETPESTSIYPVYTIVAKLKLYPWNRSS